MFTVVFPPLDSLTLKPAPREGTREPRLFRTRAGSRFGETPDDGTGDAKKAPVSLPGLQVIHLWGVGPIDGP